MILLRRWDTHKKNSLIMYRTYHGSAWWDTRNKRCLIMDRMDQIMRDGTLAHKGFSLCVWMHHNSEWWDAHKKNGLIVDVMDYNFTWWDTPIQGILRLTQLDARRMVLLWNGWITILRGILLAYERYVLLMRMWDARKNNSSI